MRKLPALIVTVLLALSLGHTACAEPLSMYRDDWLPTNQRAMLYLADVPCMWGQETVDLERQELLPVYAYPSGEGWRGAEGKAAVSLAEPFTALCWSEDGAWLLIDYEVSGGHRIGYIRCPEGVQVPVATLYPLHIPLRLTKDFSVTDDPNDSIRTIASLKAGDTVDVLGYTNASWAYIELTIDGKPARGFLPMAVLETPEETPCPDVAARLKGTWRFIGGAEVLGDGAVFDGEGLLQMGVSQDTEVFPPEALVIPVDSEPCSYIVYENGLGEKRYPGCDYILEVSRGESLSRYGLQMYEPGETYERETLGLIISEGGGGGYERADEVPVTRAPD